MSLNVVSDKVSFADAFANEEPAVDFDGDEGVQETLTNRKIFVSTGLGAMDESRDAGTDRRNVFRWRRYQFDKRILPDDVEFGLRILDKSCDRT